MRIPAADRFVAVLGYLPFLFWVPMFAKRDSLFAQFHGRQSFVLWLLWIVPSITLIVVLGILGPDLAAYFLGAVFVLTGIYFLFAVIGILKTMTRERYRMPVVADLALLLGL